MKRTIYNLWQQMRDKTGELLQKSSKNDREILITFSPPHLKKIIFGSAEPPLMGLKKFQCYYFHPILVELMMHYHIACTYDLTYTSSAARKIYSFNIRVKKEKCTEALSEWYNKWEEMASFVSQWTPIPSHFPEDSEIRALVKSYQVQLLALYPLLPANLIFIP